MSDSLRSRDRLAEIAAEVARESDPVWYAPVLLVLVESQSQELQANSKQIQDLELRVGAQAQELADYASLKRELATIFGSGKPRAGESVPAYWLRRIGEDRAIQAQELAEAIKDRDLRRERKVALVECEEREQALRQELVRAERRQTVYLDWATTRMAGFEAALDDALAYLDHGDPSAAQARLRAAALEGEGGPAAEEAS